jgi:hypothetical protein
MPATTAMLSILLLLTAGAATASESRFDFEVLLDGRPVGTHRFEITRMTEGEQQVRSMAAFDVKILGLVAYRYRHQATESWRQGCLARMESTTDDNGRKSRVAKTTQGGCTSSYAYWDPERLLQQREMLNPQTGEVDTVRIERLADEALMVRGATLAAERYRLHSDKLVIDLWYSKQGEWLQLESTAGAGRKLRYRLAAGGSRSYRSFPAGIETTNSAPRPPVSCNARSPPWARATWRARYSPSPVPPVSRAREASDR